MLGWGPWLLTLLSVLATLLVFSASAQEPEPGPGHGKIVYVLRIDGVIDLGQGPYVDRVLKTAESAGAAAVILDINTFGGRVDAAVQIRDHLLASRVRTVAFINPRAISAGALISLAAEKIAIAPAGTIGAATPVQMDSEGTKPVEEKTVSYVRKEFRSTADARGRPGAIAEAMVDSDVEIEGLIEKGKLLTLTTEEALQHDVADFEAEDIAGVLSDLELSGAEIRTVGENWAERIVRFLTHPVVSSLLMTLAVIGILVELRTPGFGIPGIVGLLSLASFFWGHWLVALVGWEELLLVVGGLALLALEVFVLPGFGVAGAFGIAALVAGLAMSLFGAGSTLTAVIYGLVRVAFSAALALIGSLVLFRLLPHLPGGRRLVLGASIDGRFPGSKPQDERPTWLGSVGISLTPLRPAGIAELSGKRVDVVTEGDFVDMGQAIEVIKDEGHRIVVRRRPPVRDEGSTE